MIPRICFMCLAKDGESLQMYPADLQSPHKCVQIHERRLSNLDQKAVKDPC